MSFRIIAKAFLLLVFIGIFMPMCCDLNGLQLADSGYIESSAVFAIYAIFVSSILGIIIGVLLLLKKRVPVIVDWIVVVFCFLCTVIAFYIAGIVNDNIDYFQTGVYVILAGAILAMIAQIISGVKRES
jgi:type IV secretory pathway VirB6-like protein